MKRWLPLALAVLAWHPVISEAWAAGRAQPVLRWPFLLLAFALPAAGVVILLRGPDLGTHAGRLLRVWAHCATLAPVIATILRVPRGLPARATWLALFGGLLAWSLWRGRRGRGDIWPGPSLPRIRPRPLLRKLHRWSALVIASFALLHFAGHLSAALSLAANTSVVNATRMIYKQPPAEALLLAALVVQIGTGLWLFRAARDRAFDSWDRLQLAAGLYLALFIAGHATATAVLFRDLSFRAASGGRSGMFGDPSFLAYYVLGPLAVFAHLACGVRSLSLRRLGPARAARLASGVLGLGATVTLLISLALCGIHLRNDRDQPQPRPAKVSVSW